MEREKDETKLRSWLKEAVEANHAALIHQIGREFLEKKDYANAFKWYEKGVPLGDYQAMYDLGVMWMNGEGREKNLSKAYAWFLLTAEYIPTNWDDYFFPPQMIEWHKKLPEKISKNMTSQEVDAGNIYYQEQKEKVICNWYNWYGHYIMTKDKRP